jgi:orotidine-5'-phosphate decarboxylase
VNGSASDPRIVVALDYADPAPALALAGAVTPAQCRLKVGKELFTRAGPALVEALVGRGYDVFLDLKFHDIPNTVARACAAAAQLGVWMVNVHALGGRRMMEAAREALERHPGPRRPLLTAVTILTSATESDLREIGLEGPPAAHVQRLASLAQAAGLDGVVCSAREAAALRRGLGPAFVLVTPGIRPAGSPPDDQRRTATAAQAVRYGADYLVIGRPVTAATDPMSALRTLNSEIAYKE